MFMSGVMNRFLEFRDDELTARFHLSPRLRISSPMYSQRHEIEMHNRLYRNWKANWIATLQSLGSQQGDLVDQFSRFDFICELVDGDGGLAGILCSTSFDLRLEDHREHSYLRRVPASLFQQLISNDRFVLGSLEFAYVAPNWRKHLIGVSLVDVLVCLCGKELFSRGVTSLFAYTRNDRSIDKIIYGRGGQPVLKNEKMHNVSIDCICIPKDGFKFDLNSPLDIKIESLWTSRVYVGATHSSGFQIEELEQWQA